MARDLTIPPPDVVLDLLVGFRRSKVMFAALELGVFDELAWGPSDAAALAGKLGVNSDAFGRLLDACVHLGLLRRSGDQIENTPAAQTYLTGESPRRLTGYIRYSNDAMWTLWRHLEDAVREGTHRWGQAYGWDGPIFSHFFHNEAAKREFLMGMHGFGLISSPHVVTAFDLGGFRHLVDLGGATGHLAIAACERYPGLQATVFDLADAVPLATEIVGQSSCGDRIAVRAGDFFSDALPPGDLYALGRILHDWAEPKIDALLKKIFDALPAGGGVLIAEKLLCDDRDSPGWALLQSLNMLTCTEGKERTLAEYEALLVRAGFTDVRGCRTSSPLDAVLARKA